MKPSAKRQVVNYLKSCYSASIQLICQTINLSRSLYYRASTRDDSDVEDKLTELAKEHSSRGFDWYYLRIRAEGFVWNRKRVLRVYRKLGFVRRRKVKKRLSNLHIESLSQPIFPNQTWSMDFMSDALEDGRKIRVFNILDDYNREAIAVEGGLSFPARRVIRVLEQLRFERGLPKEIRVDNGPEFRSVELEKFCNKHNIKLLFIPPGKPFKNAYIERFNRTFREDVLDAFLFSSLNKLKIISEEWRRKYNLGHPHQSLGGLSPAGFKHARHKVIEAYQQVKAKMNGFVPHPALTYS